jgi:hypothetical protein
MLAKPSNSSTLRLRATPPPEQRLLSGFDALVNFNFFFFSENKIFFSHLSEKPDAFRNRFTPNLLSALAVSGGLLVYYAENKRTAIQKQRERERERTDGQADRQLAR